MNGGEYDWCEGSFGGVRRRRCLVALVSLLIALAPGASPTIAAGGDATIAGMVVLPKTRSAPVINKRYEIVAHGGVLSANPPVAVVYLEGVFPPATVPAVTQITQKELTFIPSLLPVRKGTKVEFPNLDHTYHNIFSFSPAKRFDLGRYRAEDRPVPAQTFDVPGLVTLRCDIHEHMRALILVLDTPHFVITDEEGRYRMERIPPGRYVLKSWLDSKTTKQSPVEVAAGATLNVDFR
ncbi:MAG: carboxypeptidase regulatory-like domain-containing protein [Opitutaceae bacterium]|nr:carboxypeptidase regulatory-like domain-containing protein [Opitutaceae bacterium]